MPSVFSDRTYGHGSNMECPGAGVNRSRQGFCAAQDSTHWPRPSIEDWLHCCRHMFSTAAQPEPRTICDVDWFCWAHPAIENPTAATIKRTTLFMGISRDSWFHLPLEVDHPAIRIKHCFVHHFGQGRVWEDGFDQ